MRLGGRGNGLVVAEVVLAAAVTALRLLRPTCYGLLVTACPGQAVDQAGGQRMIAAGSPGGFGQ